jgi:orotidine-5'-phosphate decarboxylase
MIKPIEAVSPVTNIRDQIIVALDVDTADAAREISNELSGHVGAFKIGLQLFTAAGPLIVHEFTDAGKKIFLDLKFHDIPNTVAKASVEAAKLGVWMFNIHASGGGEMMRRAVSEVDEVCEAANIARPLIIGVTVLTSSNDETLAEIGVDGHMESRVLRLARLAAKCGLDGVVASPHEVTAVKNSIDRKDFVVVTPGIRTTFATDDDQKRVTTLRDACALGSDYVVVGRPITQAKDRLEAVERLINGRNIG